MSRKFFLGIFAFTLACTLLLLLLWDKGRTRIYPVAIQADSLFVAGEHINKLRYAFEDMHYDVVASLYWREVDNFAQKSDLVAKEIKILEASMATAPGFAGFDLDIMQIKSCFELYIKTLQEAGTVDSKQTVEICQKLMETVASWYYTVTERLHQKSIVDEAEYQSILRPLIAYAGLTVLGILGILVAACIGLAMHEGIEAKRGIPMRRSICALAVFFVLYGGLGGYSLVSYYAVFMNFKSVAEDLADDNCYPDIEGELRRLDSMLLQHRKYGGVATLSAVADYWHWIEERVAALNSPVRLRLATELSSDIKDVEKLVRSFMVAGSDMDGGDFFASYSGKVQSFRKELGKLEERAGENLATNRLAASWADFYEPWFPLGVFCVLALLCVAFITLCLPVPRSTKELPLALR